MKIGVLILIDELKAAGAENVAVNLALRLQQTVIYKPIVCATRCGGVTEEKLRNGGVSYIVLNRKHFFQFYKFAFLRRLIEKENIRIIHAHKSGSAIWGGLIGRLSNVPTVVHIHGTASTWKHTVAERLGGYTCERIVAVSESERNRLLGMGISRQKVMRIYNGINVKSYKSVADWGVRESMALPKEISIIGILAELRPEKNHEMLLLAARTVVSAVGEVCFLIIGDGEKRSQLETLAAKLGIADKCRFTGHVKDIANILSIIDIGVLCSFKEALPLTLLEYMAARKPIVATRVGGIPEVVVDGFNGFIVESGDHLALANRIELLIKNRNLTHEMGERGYSCAVKKFSEDIMLGQIEDLYHQIITDKRRRGSTESVSSAAEAEH